MSMEQNRQSTVIITGASSGVGLQAARSLTRYIKRKVLNLHLNTEI